MSQLLDQLIGKFLFKIRKNLEIIENYDEKKNEEKKISKEPIVVVVEFSFLLGC